MLVPPSFVNKGSSCLKYTGPSFAVHVGPRDLCFTDGALSNCGQAVFSVGISLGKSSLVNSAFESLDPFGRHGLVKTSSASISSLVLADFQLCFASVKNICMVGSNWEFNNFLMFLVVLGNSTEKDIYFFSVFPHSVLKLYMDVIFILFFHFFLRHTQANFEVKFSLLRVCV